MELINKQTICIKKLMIFMKTETQQSTENNELYKKPQS